MNVVYKEEAFISLVYSVNQMLSQVIERRCGNISKDVLHKQYGSTD